MYIRKKIIKNQTYNYLVKDIRIKNTKKQVQIYLGTNNKPTKEHISKLNQKIYLLKSGLQKYSKIQSNLISIFNNNLVSIILFGSYASNTQSENSDIDILLVCNKLPSQKYRHQLIKEYQLKHLLKTNKQLSFVLITKDEFIDWIKSLNPLLLGISSSYEYLYDPHNFFKKHIEIFKNRMRIDNLVYTDKNKTYNLNRLI
jgi:uncharacterized protein